MSNWEKLAKHYDAEFVGGDLMARIDNKNVTLGTRAGSAVVLTLDAEGLLEALNAKPRKGPKSATPEPDADNELIPDPELIPATTE